MPTSDHIHIPPPAPELAEIARHLGRIADALETLAARPAPVDTPPAATTPASVLTMSVLSLGLTDVTSRKLTRRGITTVGDLCQRTAAELQNTRWFRFGPGRVACVQRKLAAYGLRLANDPPPATT